MSNVLSPAPSPVRLRTMLEEMVIGDLLGPAGGPEEELTERNVRDRYLVGVLAPRSQPQPVPAKVEEEDDEETPLLPDELSEGGADTLDDGTTDKDVPLVQAHLPSSFGLTFCVDKSAQALKVEVRWGQYKRETKPDQIDEHTGRPKRVWKRYQRSGIVKLRLDKETIPPTSLHDEFPNVYVKGKVRKRDHGIIVTLFLVNGQEEGRPKDESHLFQPELIVSDPDGAAIFCKHLLHKTSAKADPGTKLEDDTMAMLYRRHTEFAVGHGVSVHAESSPDAPDRGVLVKTTFIPRYEVPRTTPPTAADAAVNPAFGKLVNLVLDMKELADLQAEQVKAKLGPLVTAYRDWIDGQETLLKKNQKAFEDFADAPAEAIRKCRQNLVRIEAGLKLLEEDEQAGGAFRFMNRAMWLQRTHSLYSEQVRRGGQPDFDKDIDVPANRTWYPFQIAFILLNLPGITKLDHPDRSEEQTAIADLLFFPTGGGKTEAYLGLSAYTIALRRLQGTVAGRSGENGVAVLMRYTLRLLTIQQFQRATALICACESIRREALEKSDKRWGETPFRIGLWVGRRTTPNKTEDAAEAIKQLRSNPYAGVGSPGVGSPYQLTACPWCGSAIEPGRDLDARLFPNDVGRTLTYCGDKLGKCLFSKRQAPDEGLPVVVVDEEIYRRLPSLLIATVDKFAQMPWKGEVQMLFGMVNSYCERHGFRSPEIEDSQSHPKTRGGLPAAKTVEHTPLRPPDLIIQDELHLISGPLGTLVGLYETAIDRLCTWDVGGKKVRPKVIASTATIKSADVQVHKLFLRTVNIFPPHGLDVQDNFFSLQREPSEENPGRVYIGVCATGRRLKAALIRVYTAFLCSAQALYEKYGGAADPWMSLIGYFNSMRELGGMRRLVDDDVFTRCKKMDRRGLAKRFFGTDYLAELTSRMRSEDIPQILDRLEAVFDPELEAQRKDAYQKKQWKSAPKKPLDVLLATNMISVGVDVKRLGLMVVAGQPKACAEYIQATSRVGRNPKAPGLICTVFNWARPRDLSHYEAFEHYHATFYKHVEPLSVTPFSPGALQRGLAGLLVALVRLRCMEYNTNEAASRVQASDPYVQDAIAVICRRAELVGDGTAVADYCRAELQTKVDLWQAEAQNTTGGRTLTYTEPRSSGDGPKRGTTINLLRYPSLEKWEEFTCLNSLREVEPTVKLIMDDGGLDEGLATEDTENTEAKEEGRTCMK
jgi:ribosomal protein L24E